MTKDTFMEQMELVLDGAKFDFDTKLEDIEEWDSIAVVSLMSLLHVSAGEIKKAETIAELFAIANGGN